MCTAATAASAVLAAVPVAWAEQASRTQWSHPLPKQPPLFKSGHRRRPKQDLCCMPSSESCNHPPGAIHMLHRTQFKTLLLTLHMISLSRLATQRMPGTIDRTVQMCCSCPSIFAACALTRTDCPLLERCWHVVAADRYIFFQNASVSVKN